MKNFRDPEFARFFTMAKGSASELECQLILALDLGHLGEDELLKAQYDVEKIQKMLSAFITTLARPPNDRLQQL
jgi:four helix bundle protein